MHYWSERPVKVIVLDGSDCKLRDQDIDSVGTNVTYIHRKLPYNERLLLVSDLITTPYAMLCCDDDYMLPSGIVDCIEFLNKTEDYTACNGRIIGFNTVNDGWLKIWPEKAHHKNHLVNQDSFFERIMYHFNNFNITTIYAVHRTDSLIYCIKYASIHGYNSPYVWETLFELLSTRYGKSTILPTVIRLSSQENQPVSNLDWNRKVSISDWYDDPSNSKEIRIYFETARDAFSKLGHHFDNLMNEALISAATEVRIDISRKYELRKRISIQAMVIKLFKNTVFYKTARYFYRISLNKKTDYKDDFFYSKSKYKFNRLKYEHEIIINSQAENEIIEIFNTVLNFKTKSSSHA